MKYIIVHLYAMWIPRISSKLSQTLAKPWMFITSRFSLPYLPLGHGTAWKVSKYGIFMVCIFPDSDWIRRDTEYLYSVQMWENTDQKKHRIWALFTQCWYLKISVMSPNKRKYGQQKTYCFNIFSCNGLY